jgi:hypothetical protein
MTVKIQLRRDTAANWSVNNPILEPGEPGLETDTKRVKYGDGATTWNNLTYALSGNIYTANIIGLTTANVSEVTNLYFTNARVYSNVTAIGFASNTYLSQQISLVDSNIASVASDLAALDSDNVTQGTLNLYYSDLRVYDNVVTLGFYDKANIADLTYSNISGFIVSNLTDVANLSLTVDELAFPAIAKLEVSNSSSNTYTFTSHYGSTDNPNVYVISGTTIAFNLDTDEYPFLLQESDGGSFANVQTNLKHVAIDGTLLTGSSAQGKTVGTLYWNVPFGTSNTYQYISTSNASMVGNVIVKDISAI